MTKSTRTVDGEYFTIRKAEKLLIEKRQLTIPSLRAELGVKSENTAKRYLLILERDGKAKCLNPNGKPMIWAPALPADSLKMAFIDAYILNKVHDVVKTILPAELLQDTKLFDAANDTYGATKNNRHHSKEEKYARSVPDNLYTHVASGNICSKVLEPIKSAIYREQPLHIEVDDCDHYIEGATLFEIDNTLYVKGKETRWQGQSMTFEAQDITAARIHDRLDFQRPRVA